MTLPARLDWRTLLFLAGTAAGVGVCVRYAAAGAHPALPWLLVGAVVAIALGLRRAPSPDLPRPGGSARADVLAVAALLALSVPLYGWRVYSVPWQVNTDEVSIMLMTRRMLANAGTDVLGITDYFGFPAAAFLAVGRLAEAIGGIGLLHSRQVHAAMGVTCVLLAYGFFRQLAGPLRAASLAAILGTNHALFAISRMAMRDNSGLLAELLALLLFAFGVRRRSRTALFLAGVAAGLGFYAYFPGRIAIVVLVATLGSVVVLGGGRPLRPALGHGALVLLGWAIVATPVMVASWKQPKAAFSYARQQILVYPEGQALAMQWTGETTPAGAWKANVRSGLTTFNAPLHDQGWIYPNRGHGFVDPLTGVLLWVGFVVAGVRVLRRRTRLLEGDEAAMTALGDLLALVGFLGLYLALALLLTKAPNYTRLLVVLPYTSWLAGSALWDAAELLARRAAPARAAAWGAVAALGGTAVVASWNVVIFADFVAQGRRQGNDVGSTGRYVDARRHLAGHTWVLVADPEHQYYTWGEEWQWRDWVGTFAGSGQTTRVVKLAELATLELDERSTVFITRRAWEDVERDFAGRHPHHDVQPLTPDGRLLVVQVRAAR